MTTSPNSPASVEAPSGSVPSTCTPEEQQRAQHKAQKKQRKLDRLLFFLGWCEGCRSYGNSC